MDTLTTWQRKNRDLLFCQRQLRYVLPNQPIALQMLIVLGPFQVRNTKWFYFLKIKVLLLRQNKGELCREGRALYGDRQEGKTDGQKVISTNLKDMWKTITLDEC